MGKATGTIDYGEILKKLPAATRQKLYHQLIDGKGDQPGIAEQYVATLAEYRSIAELVEPRREYIANLPPEISEKVKAEILEDFARLLWLVEQRRQGLDSIASELARLQASLLEFEEAGTKA